MNPWRRFAPIIITVILVIIAGVGLLLLHNSRSFSGSITVQVTPASATLTMNDKVVTAGKIGVNPGSYTFKATLKGFDSSSKTITVKRGDSLYVGLALLPNSPSTADWYQKHPTDQQLYEIITGKYFDITSSEQTQTLPLIQDLPFIDQFYRIDYGQSKANPTDQSAVALYITYYSQAGKQQALDWIKFKGYDPTSLEIIYIDKTGQ